MDLIRCKNNKKNYFDKIFNVNFPTTINGNHTTNKATIINAAIILHTYLNIFFLISPSIANYSSFNSGLLQVGSRPLSFKYIL